MVMNLPASAGDSGGAGLIPRSGQSPSRKYSDLYPCRYSYLDRVVWQAAVHGITESQT